MTEIGIQRLPAGMLIVRPGKIQKLDDRVVEAVDVEGGTERDPKQDDREGPDQVEEPRDDPVGSAAEIGGEQREDYRQNRGDHRRDDPDHERVASAVEQSGAHVAAKDVRTEEVRGAGGAPLRTDRDAPRSQDCLAVFEDGAALREDRDLLAVLVDEPACVRVVRREVRDLALVERREQADEHDEQEHGKEGERGVVAAEAAAREHPRTLALDLRPAALVRRQLGGGVESELLLGGSGGRH